MSNRTGIQLAYPFEEKRLLKWEPPFLIQPKLDGVRCRALALGQEVLSQEEQKRVGVIGASILHDEGYTLLSSEENIIFGMKHIEEALDRLPFRTELDGELYSHGMTFEEIFSRTSREANFHPDACQVGYYIFDICNETMPQIKRTNWLYSQQDLIRPPLWLVTTMIATTLQEVMDCLESFTSVGYEGIIVRECSAPYVRRRSTAMMKWKPKRSDEYSIVGWKEEVSINGVAKGRLGALVCESDGEEFSVGSGFTDKDRYDLWSKRGSLIGQTCVVSYQHLTAGRKVPRFPVLVSLKERR